MTILIDPPSPFAPKPEWTAFLKEMMELLEAHPDNEEVKENIEEARTILAG